MNLSTILEHLDWCTTQPHTVDQVVGIYGEQQARAGRDFGYGKSNDQLVSALRASAPGGGSGGKGGHSDPTPAAALRNEPDAIDTDPTIARITDVCERIASNATALDRAVSAELGLTVWPAHVDNLSRTAAITRASSRLHHAAPNVDTARATAPTSVDHLLAALAADAAWLHGKLNAIWLESKGEHLTPAVQRAITPCACCTQWGYTEQAVADGTLCAGCEAFRRDYKCWPTRAIKRELVDYGRKRLSQKLIDDAKAAARARK